MMDVGSVSPVPDRAGRVPDPQDSGTGFPMRHFRSVMDGEHGPVPAHWVSNLTLEWCTGFPAALFAPGVSRSSCPVLPGFTGSTTLCYREDLLPCAPGHLSSCHCLVLFLLPPHPSTSPAAVPAPS